MVQSGAKVGRADPSGASSGASGGARRSQWGEQWGEEWGEAAAGMEFLRRRSQKLDFSPPAARPKCNFQVISPSEKDPKSQKKALRGY